MQDKLIEAEIDDGILGVVLVLNDAGVKTFSSCQGGGYGWGHGYLRPIVCFDGDDSEGERAEKIATDAGYQVFQVQRVWYTRDGERVGPFWEMEFVAGAACRAPKDRAAVRAHDAGTDETERDSSGDSRIPASVEGLYSWAQIEDAILTRWDGSEELEHWLKLLRYELKIDPEPPASHAAESAPPIPFEDWWASQGRFIDPDTEDVPWFDKRKGLAEAAYCAGQSSVKFAKFYSHTKAADSAPQLDAEDPAEPVEDVVERMLDIWGFSHDKWTREHAARACVEARKGYVKLEDVEKAIRKTGERYPCISGGWASFAAQVCSEIAPKPSPDPAVEAVMAWVGFNNQALAENCVNAVRKSDPAPVTENGEGSKWRSFVREPLARRLFDWSCTHSSTRCATRSEREIAEVEEEIESITSDVRWFAQGAQYEDRQQESIHRRILAVEQARLAELRRGMKEGSE